MGTSASGKGPKSTTPLLPNWIDEFPTTLSDTPEENMDVEIGIDIQQETTPARPDLLPELKPVEIANNIRNRYREARSNFNSYILDKEKNTTYLSNSLKRYVNKGGGGSTKMAKRMIPSITRIANFSTAVNNFKAYGVAETLRSLNLETYSNKPVLDILSALTDIIFDNQNLYNNIQDDAITKLAYTNTINRIVEEIEGIDLHVLTNANIEVMMAIFIEESIATRVICDIGVKLFEKAPSCEEIIEVEETVYQIIKGLVRNEIMPEIIATQQGLVQNIEKNIEKIYRIAFDCIAETLK